MINLFKPPFRTNTSKRRSTLKIFLAGSIEMGKAEDWQSKVVDRFDKAFNMRAVDIYNPRRDEWDASWKQDFENPQFSQQVNWELSNLERADTIILNLLPETQSPISLLELGLFASSGKLLVVCPKEFWRSGNVHIVCDRYNIPLFDTLDELLNHIIIAENLVL